MEVRLATANDAPGIQAIYAPIVLSTFISFETQAPTVEQMRERVLAAHPRYPWLVAAEGDLVTGYARASRHREREAYQWSVDVSVYVHRRAPRIRSRDPRQRGYACESCDLAASGLVNMGFRRDEVTIVREALAVLT